MEPADFDRVAHWLFDLDNTLYPYDCNVFAQTDRRIGEFVAKTLGVDEVEARRVQKQFLVSHGTTLRGLMEFHQVAAPDYLDFVHDVSFEPIPPNPALGNLLRRLPGRRYVFTNADRPYAEKVLERLGIADCFDGMFDIVDADYYPKPHGPTYDACVKALDVDPARTVMVEDMARNLVPAHAMGMTTVWLRNPSPWSQPDNGTDHIHYEIDDLDDWLRSIAG